MPSDHTSKRCIKCKEWFPLTADYFHKHPKMKDGFRSDCRACHNGFTRKWKVENADRRKAVDAVYRLRNADRIREHHRAYYVANRARILERNRETYAQNVEREHIRNKAYRDSHKEQEDQRHKRWRDENIERARANSRRWQRAHLDVFRRNEHIRRARVRGLPHTLTLSEWEDIKAFYNYSCAYCGRAWYEIEGKLVQEHVVPTTQGGGYTKENIVPACRSCNGKKYNKTPEQVGLTLTKRYE